jgi:glycosyltransferase involved in cell wall biosynthesis
VLNFASPPQHLPSVEPHLLPDPPESPRSAEGAPEVSVVVGAYSREDFVIPAVQSVLDQTIDRRRFDVLVTKNFRSLRVDRFLETHGIESLFDEDRTINRWLFRAARSTRAPLIAFLDDDDLFEPTRLEHVLEVFRAHPQTGYYRNRVSVVDERGAPIPEAYWGKNEIDPLFDGTGPVWVGPDQKEAMLPFIRRTYSFFNSSTIVLRREVLRPDLTSPYEGFSSPDPFFLIAAIASPFGLFLDDRRLTLYRHHGGNVSGEVRTLRKGLADHRQLTKIARSAGLSGYAGWFEQRSREVEKRLLSESIVEGVAKMEGRPAVARRAGEYARFLGRHPDQRHWDFETWAALAYGSASVLFPAGAQRAYAVRRTRRAYAASSAR